MHEAGAASGPSVRTVVLAAGRSERMGFDKLAAPFAGVPLLRRVALALAPLRPLVVTTAALAPLIADIPGVDVLRTERTAGPSATLRLADAAVPAGERLAVVPGDAPFLDAARVRAFVCRAPAEADLAWPVVGETPGHPVLWSPRARVRIVALHDDEPPMRLRAEPALRCVALVETDPAYVEDVDTPDRWEQAQARVQRPG